MAGTPQATGKAKGGTYALVTPNVTLTIRIQHVLEPHPLRVEIQIHVPGAAVAVLADEQFGGALDLAAPVVHVFAEEGQYDVRVVLHGAQRAEIVESRPA